MSSDFSGAEVMPWIGPLKLDRLKMLENRFFAILSNFCNFFEIFHRGIGKNSMVKRFMSDRSASIIDDDT